MSVKIALSGKRRSGKSTVTSHLFGRASQSGFTPAKISHGTWLKQLARQGLNIPATDREALQLFGTDCILNSTRKYFGHELFWTNLLLSDAFQLESYGYNFFICDDLRLRPQADKLKEEGYLLIRLDTTPDLQDSRDQEGKSAGKIEHRTETDLDDYPHFDLRLAPNQTISQIGEAIWGLLTSKGLVE